VEPLTNPGRFTYDALKLWREQLCHFRARMSQCQTEAARIHETLERKEMSAQERRALELLLGEIAQWLEPPIFHRPRG
jgi:hypothetical protein